MEFIFEDEILEEDYNRLREEVGWGAINSKQAEAGLKNSACVLSCKVEERVVGSARLIWDGGYVAYIADVMVSPKYQRNGIGLELVRRLLRFTQSLLQEDWSIMVVLVAAKGKEAFYEKLGFERRPTEVLGAGMTQWVRSEL